MYERLRAAAQSERGVREHQLHGEESCLKGRWELSPGGEQLSGRQQTQPGVSA